MEGVQVFEERGEGRGFRLRVEGFAFGDDAAVGGAHGFRAQGLGYRV